MSRCVLAVWLIVSLFGPWSGPAPAEGAPAGQRPIAFPDDEAPHTNRSEWWYYTGHLDGSDGRRYGFELTFFQSFLSDGRPGYVGHFAVTDPSRAAFRFAQRVAIGAQPPAEPGFALAIDTWTMRGALGHDALSADMPGYAVDLTLDATRPPVLHGGGYIHFGVAGDSYYYSRSRLQVAGKLMVGDTVLDVTGLAWMDHQWGDFVFDPARGGWDWFSAQLDDGSDLMVVVLRDGTGAPVGGFGSFVAPDNAVTDLTLPEVQVAATGQWGSPFTGINWPSGWRLAVPKLNLQLAVEPVLPNQELDTRMTTRVAYWEGLSGYTGTRGGNPVTGQGYVELTGYLP